MTNVKNSLRGKAKVDVKIVSFRKLNSVLKRLTSARPQAKQNVGVSAVGNIVQNIAVPACLMMGRYKVYVEL